LGKTEDFLLMGKERSDDSVEAENLNRHDSSRRPLERKSVLSDIDKGNIN
jgi:hypothetical protein